MFDAIAPRYDLVNRLMTFGMDRGWRRRAVQSLGLARDSRILDVACGTGDLCRELDGAGYHPLGLDFSRGMLTRARTSAPLVQGDALRLPFPDAAFDGAISGFGLRNFTALEPFLAELQRTTRSGGRIALLEVAEPPSRLLAAGHSVYFRRVVPGLGALLSDGAAYRYLPRSVAYLPPAGALVGMVSRAGFEEVDHRLLSGGITQLVTATRRTP
jgi:demethylmenaquinone methyltransferase/2-methoxy-6-polyprenyl-1,4-benzoquinol methylase